jgi:type IV pilus assembly protein PilC
MATLDTRKPRTGTITVGGPAIPGRKATNTAAAPRSTPMQVGEAKRAARKKQAVKVKITAKDLAVFTRQFSVMIQAGLPLVQSLEILSEQQVNKGFASVLSGVRSSVESGSTLANALREYPKVFDGLFTNMVEAGEAGGILDAIFQRLSGYIEKAVKLKAAVKSALIYPTSVMVIAMAVIFLLLWKVVPIFATLFAGMGVDMPLPTLVVIKLSHFVGSFAWLMVLVVGIFVYLVKRYYRTAQGRLAIDALILRIPVLGNVMRKIAVARFTRTLGTLLTSGVPMLEAMDITAHTSGNAVVENAILSVRKAVETGSTVVDPLRESGVFPNMVVQMVGVGEHTGGLDTMLGKVADFYEDEVDVAVADLLAAMEPMIIVFLGLVVGGIVISMYLPLFSLIGKLAG